MERVKHWIRSTDFAPTSITTIKNVLLAASIALSAFSLLTATGLATTQHFPSYFFDEWTWLGFAFNESWLRGSFCRFFGHPTVIPNLHLLANYYLLDGSPLARGLVVAAVSLMGTLGIAKITLTQMSVSRFERGAIYLAFAALGLWPAINHKFTWSFGLTDSLVTLGTLISGAGLLAIPNSKNADHSARRALFLLAAGGGLGTFSFGSGLAIWPAFAGALVLLRVPFRVFAAYIACAVACIALAHVGLPNCVDVPGGKSALGSVFSTNVAMNTSTIITTALVTIGSFPAHALANVSRFSGPAFSILWASIALIMIGTMGAVALRFWRRGPIDRPTLALLAIAATSVGAAVLVGLARSAEFGVSIAYAPRYAALSLPFWASAFALLLRHLLKGAVRPKPAALVVLLPSIALAAQAAFIAHSNTAWSSMYLMFRRNANIGALHFLVDPDPKSVGIKRFYVHSNRITAALPKLSAERKDFMGSQLARYAATRFDQSGSEPENVPDRCKGVVVARPDSDTPTTKVLSGWAVSPANEPMNWIEIYESGKLTGLGMPSAIAEAWQQDYIDDMSFPVQFVMRYARPLARAWNLYPGWIAVVHTDPGKPLDVTKHLDIYMRSTAGNLCRIGEPKV